VLMRSYSKKLSISLYEMIKKILSWDWETPEKLKYGQMSQKPPVVDEESKHSLEKFLKMFENQLQKTKKESGGQMLYDYLTETDYLDKMVTAESEKMEKTVAKISALFEKIKIFESRREEKGVVEVLDWLLVQMELGEDSMKEEAEENKVNVLTVHSAKGLEFEAVFLVNLVDQRFPTRRRGEEIPLPEELIKEILPEGDSHEQEERRLFYVGLTRAKSRLFLTGARSYNEESKREKKVSIFVKETLGEEVENKALEKKEQMSLLFWEKKEEEETVREKTDGWVVNYLSYSQMDGFSVCPRQYRYRYILNLPSPPSAAQNLGTAVHESLKDFYQKTKNSLLKGEKEEILKLLGENWQSVGFDNKKHEEETRKKAEEILVWFYENCFDKGELGKVLVLEQPFSLRISPSLKVGGKIDRIDELVGGEIEIIDYKTGGKVPSQKEVDENEQLTVYALAAGEIGSLRWRGPIEKIKLSLWFLDGQVKVSTRRKVVDIEKMRERIIKTAEEISKSDFPAKAGRPFPCDFCPYRLICDAWK
jgi:DNA helicase II / ATP-dependent DNA helicase PcrA